MVKKEEKVKTLRETIQMGFNLEEGHCIKGIESCLVCAANGTMGEYLWGTMSTKFMHAQCFVVMICNYILYSLPM